LAAITPSPSRQAVLVAGRSVLGNTSLVSDRSTLVRDNTDGPFACCFHQRLTFISGSIMTGQFLIRSVAACVLAAAVAIPAGAQSVAGKGKTGAVPNPVDLDTTGMFQAKFVSVGDDMFIGGQPTEKAIRDLKAKGVTTIVNLRMPEEMAQVGFDEAGLVKELGMKYVHIPMRGTPENPYGPKALDTFAAAMASADGKVLLHCTVAWRASHLWAAYLIRDRNMPVATVLAQTRQINLRDDQPFGDQQPLEGFLGRTIPEMAHPKK
jgi:uncharacterized protein (TIGR01244 family)